MIRQPAVGRPPRREGAYPRAQVDWHRTAGVITVVLSLVLAILAAGCARQSPLGPTSSVQSASDRAHRRWGVAEVNGVRWLVTPLGEFFYSKGVNTVNGALETPKSRRREAYFWGNFVPSQARWREVTRSRLADWGFNTRGAWSDPAPEFDLPLTVELDLGRNAKLHWADPFDPAMEETTERWAESLTAPYRGNPHLLGYFTDNEVGWWNGPLFGWYLNAGWDNHTKRVLWQLLHDRYLGSWPALLRDWVPTDRLRSFEDLKHSGAAMRLRPGGRGIDLVNRFTYLCARRYYGLVERALRRADPGALVLGDRLPLYYNQDAVLAAADLVDVLSTNYNVDLSDGWVAPYYFDGLERLSGKPVLVSEFFFAAHENRSGNLNVGHLMTVPTQSERARGVGRALRNFARLPNVVGTHWFQYYDHPLGGRADGEDYNMGLVDTANRPYEEVVGAFRRLNPALDRIHGRGRFPATVDRQCDAVPLERAHRRIDLADASLLDWEMNPTRIGNFQTPEPYVPFADVHLAWAPEGLYLASLASNYLDPDLLAPQTPFPLSETFQLHLLIEREGRRHHFAVHLRPQRSEHFADRLVVEPLLYRYLDERPAERLPAAGHVQRLARPLPHIAIEAFFPAQWLGAKRLDGGSGLRMNVALVSYYRERTMSWAGVPPSGSGLLGLGTLRKVVLRDDATVAERGRACR